MKHTRLIVSLTSLSAALSVTACITGPDGVDGETDVAALPIQGTIYTIVLENHDADVIDEMPYLKGLAQKYARADAYFADHHPSLPNYLQMLSGTDQGVTDDEGPDKHQFDSDNLAAQLDEANIPWRVYMEDMGEPCLMRDKGHYAVRHNPFVYFTSVTGDKDKCREHVVDMDEHLSADLGASEYRYMWITPNECNDMHDCGPGKTDDWLAELVPQIMASDGYKNGGAIFFLWDEGGQDASYVFGGKQVIPAIVVSDQLSSAGFVSEILYSHDSYLATVEDALGLPRLASTKDSPPMSDFFSEVTDEAADPATDSSAQ